MANHRHEPTELHRSEVKLLSSFGMQEKRIADYIGIAEKTLRKYYREELDSGIATQIMTASKGLFQKVQSGNLTAIIFFLKTKGGFSEKIDLSNEDGTLAPAVVRRVFAKSGEEVRRLEAVIEKSEKAQAESSTVTH
ncbi:MAG: hypothetical protein COA78_07020 [Blastopirellula sp.]|nr:MAG: hypothetical protein COA78_07020 [Blastopirellula sp.]